MCIFRSVQFTSPLYILVYKNYLNNPWIQNLINLNVVKKSTEKRWFRDTPSGSRPAFACRLALESSQKLKKYIYFKTFSLDFRRKITGKGLKWTKKVENRWKKVFQLAFGYAQDPKAGQNTQHLNMLQRKTKFIFTSVSVREYLSWVH